MLKFPSKVFGLIMLTAKTIDCTAVIVLLSVAIVGNILLRNFTPLISLGINTDLALLLAHILILTCRVPYIMNLTMTECKFVSIFCQYFMTVHFIFIFFESMQVYSIKTGLIGWGYPIPLQQQLILGWGLPLLSTGVNAAIKFNEYPLGWSCIVNYKTTVAVSIVLPMVMIAWATVVVFEASSADARTLKLLLSVSRTQFHAASVGLFTTAFYAAASCVSFVTVSLALFTIDEFVFSLGIILSTVTVATIVICRFLQNEKLAGYFSGLFKRLRNQDSKSISETDFATVQHIQPAIPSIKPYQNPPQTVQPTKKPVSFFVSAKIDDSSFSNKKTF